MGKKFNHGVGKQAQSIKLTKGLVKRKARFFMFKFHIYHLIRLPLSISSPHQHETH